MKLSQDRAERLGRLAVDRGTTEDALIEKALDMLFSVTEGRSDEERDFWARVSADSLYRVWDNPADARYDDWKTLYEIPER